MLIFPQMRDGAVVQLPYRWRQHGRLVQQELPGGAVYHWADTRGIYMEWHLRLQGLSDSERAAIDDLFSATSGRRGSFVFLDPFGNLLAHSESLASPVWTKDAGVVVTHGRPDPAGGISATRVSNPTGQTIGVSQRIGAPASYGYTGSVWVRSAAPALVELGVGDPAFPTRMVVQAGTSWKRVSVTGKSTSTLEWTDIWVRPQPGSEVEVYGWQLEPTAQASAYRKTSGRSGVYNNSRFGLDELDWISQGPGSYAVEALILGM